MGRAYGNEGISPIWNWALTVGGPKAQIKHYLRCLFDKLRKVRNKGRDVSYFS